MAYPRPETLISVLVTPRTLVCAPAEMPDTATDANATVAAATAATITFLVRFTDSPLWFGTDMFGADMCW